MIHNFLKTIWQQQHDQSDGSTAKHNTTYDGNATPNPARVYSTYYGIYHHTILAIGVCGHGLGCVGLRWIALCCVVVCSHRFVWSLLPAAAAAAAVLLLLCCFCCVAAAAVLLPNSKNRQNVTKNGLSRNFKPGPHVLKCCVVLRYAIPGIRLMYSSINRSTNSLALSAAAFDTAAVSGAVALDFEEKKKDKKSASAGI